MKRKNKENDFNDKMVNDALNSIKDFSESNTIIGETIITPNGTVIIPVSKITAGLISGRGEYGRVKFFQPQNDYPHSNGGGGIVSVKPIGFIIEKGESVKFLKCPTDILDRAIDSIDGIIDNVISGAKDEA